MTIRVINRVIVHDARTRRILLVRNRDAHFWYIPGGEWKHREGETPSAGGAREVLEETGIRAQIRLLLYVRTFRPNSHLTQLELLWLARSKFTRLPQGHMDQDGIVEEARWFRREELRSLKVFPAHLKKGFWNDLKHKQHNSFLNE